MFWVAPAFGASGGQERALPPVVESVVRNLDFFARPWVFWRHENHFLHDVNRLNDELIGVTLISPSGFEVNLVYDVSTLKIVYRNSSLHRRHRREAMRHESISIADAVRLARSVAEN